MSGPVRIWLGAGFYLGLVLLTTVALIISPVAFWVLRLGKGMHSGVAARTLIWWYGHCWCKLFAAFTPVTCSGTGFSGCSQDLPQPCVMVANHQSYFDTYAFGAIPIKNLVLLVRAWPFKIPFYAPFMRKAGYINTEAMNAQEIMARSEEVLGSGATLVVFPEGTRSGTGKIGRFHSGAFLVAARCNVPVVPVCFDGTGAFLRRGEFFPRRAKVRITVLDPVYPEEFAVHGEAAHMAMRREVKRRIQARLESQTEASYALGMPSNHGGVKKRRLTC